MKNNALLEIGVEELPPSEIKSIVNQFKHKLPGLLENKRLKYGDFEVFYASRRLGVLICNLADKQEDAVEEKRGPAENIAYKNGEPTKALKGFIKGNNANLKDIETKEVKGSRYIFLKRKIEGKSSETILPEIFKEIVTNLEFRRPMRWGNGDYKFVRPVRWVVALYGENIIDLKLFGKKAGNISFGHRFFYDEVEVTPDNYFEKLKKSLVISRPSERRERVISELNRIENESQLRIPRDTQLIDETIAITEYPRAVTGEFLDKFLELPEEIIIVTIKHHLRTFPAYKKNKIGKTFVAFQDGPEDPEGNVSSGYEKVINARLEDAHFYYEKDLSKPLEYYIESLKEMVFQAGLGTYYEKTQRIMKISDLIFQEFQSNSTDEELRKNIERTALLSRADLSTMVVYEFPELQGIIGRIYANASGESYEVSMGIQEFYEPSNENFETITGAVTGVADRVDSIVGNFALGNIPTGSKDPYALRRKMGHLFKTVTNMGWDLDLKKLFKKCSELLERSYEDLSKQIEKFTESRYEAFLIEHDFSLEVARAVSQWWSRPHPGDLLARSLTSIFKGENFEKLLIAYQRVHNISRKHDSVEYDGKLFVEKEEKELFNAYINAKNKIDRALEEHKFDLVLDELIKLKEPIDNYFDNVFVMDNQTDIRLNRLCFLKALDQLFLNIADLSQLLSGIENE
ncbi:MAG: glycine--tRNA ligase subunit beta [Kosmotogaceae bacterium]